MFLGADVSHIHYSKYIPLSFFNYCTQAQTKENFHVGFLILFKRVATILQNVEGFDKKRIFLQVQKFLFRNFTLGYQLKFLMVHTLNICDKQIATPAAADNNNNWHTQCTHFDYFVEFYVFEY